MDVEARAATGEDLAVVVELCATAVDELRRLRGGDIWSRREARVPPFEDSVRATHEAADSALMVGMIDGTVVGYGSVRVAALHDGALLGEVLELYVLPEARAVGVGEAMMNRLVDWCRDRGCVGVDSLALPGDRHTKNFFETFGLVARAIRVHRSL